MRKETSEWSVRMLADFERRIDVDAEFQRALVWSTAQQALLIDSILRGFDIPKIFLRKLPDGNPYLFEVIDGKQRLTAIWKFVSDQFHILKTADLFPGLGDLRGLHWSELPEQAKDRLQFTNITVSKIEAEDEDEVRELFLRLQRGEPLKAAEKRNAIAGPVRDFVAEQLAQHRLWNLTGIRPARFGREEHAAIILTLVRNDGPAHLKGADLLQLYEDLDFDPRGEHATKTLRLMDFLADTAAIDPTAIRTRWAVVDLSISIMRLDREARPMDPAVLMNFFQQFEHERRSVSATLTDLQTKLVEDLQVVSDIDNALKEDEGEGEGDALAEVPPDMLTYHLAFSREGASEENVRTRSQVMYDRLLVFLAANSGNGWRA